MHKKTTLNEVNNILKEKWRVKFDDFEAIEPYLDAITDDSLKSVVSLKKEQNIENIICKNDNSPALLHKEAQDMDSKPQIKKKNSFLKL